MKDFNLYIAAAALVTGIVAAVYWWRSASIEQSLNPKLPVGDVTEDPKVLLDYLHHIYEHFFKLQDTLRYASRLNRNAALWSGISVFLSGLSAAVGNWTSN
jgi:hypothetical protein